MQEQKYYDLTSPQKNIWLTEEYYKGSPINSICGTALINENVDFKLLKKAIEIVLEKNDIFKIKFTNHNNKIQQYFSDDINYNIVHKLVRDINELNSFRERIISKPFNLLNSHPYSFYIFEFPNQHGAFTLNIHHILADSWTLGVISKQIIKTYGALKNNQSVDTSILYTYEQYIKNEQAYLTSNKYINDKEFWENKFSTIPEVAKINPIKKISASNDVSNNSANRILFNINNYTVLKLKEYCKSQKVSLYNFFMAVLAIYTSNVSNSNDFVIGTPVLNRTNAIDKSTAGMFVATQPFRIHFDGICTFSDFLKRISTDSFNMLKHQKYPYQELLENLRKNNNKIPNLYSILFSYQITNALEETKNINHSTEWTFNGCSADNIAIQIFDINNTGSLNISYDYQTSLFDEKDIENIHHRLLHIIDQIISRQNIEIKDIEFITSEEKNDILYTLNNTYAYYPTNKTFVDLFEEQVQKAPNNIAIVYGNQVLTYQELNKKSNQLARFLIKNGVQSNSIVGILLDRSVDLLVSILAVLKAGGSYLPIDINYPADRINYMLENSSCNILISNSSINTNIININLTKYHIDIETMSKDNLNIPIEYSDNSYVIYTSGSTGKPKGVVLTHKGLYNLTCYCNNNIDYLKNNIYRNIVSVTTVSFDIFIFETLISLQRGLKVIISNSDEQVIPKLLNDLIDKQNVEIIQTTPSRMQLLLDNIEEIPAINKLKFITLAGEKLSIDLVSNLKKLIPNVTIYNGYGPSETTVFATLTNVTNQKEISIGRPLANNKIYILNDNKNLCPQNYVGEIYISGDNVGKGYINNPELTNEVFLDDLFDSTQKMYKSGDIGYYSDSGEIICLGRQDNQLKIRGQRIEAGEIESLILSFSDNIKNCVVLKDTINQDEFLNAYYTSEEELNTLELKSFLRKYLPIYMIPKYFFKIETMPYTFNGKIDKKELKNLKIDFKNVDELSSAESNEILDIFKTVLNCKKINLNNSFIDNGGDSLSAINLSIEISKLLNINISVKDILNSLSISELIQSFDTFRASTQNVISIADKSDFYPASAAQKRIYYASKMAGEDSLIYNTPFALLFNRRLDANKLLNSFKELIKRHSSFRTEFILIENELKQRVLDYVDFEIETKHIGESEINKQIDKFPETFSFEKAPLLRARLCFVDITKSLLLIDSHHIIMDGTSLKIMLQELIAIYNNKELPKNRLEYKDYSVWEANNINLEDEEYWLNKFKTYEFESLNLPYDYTLPATPSYVGEKININFNHFDKVNTFARKFNLSPYVVFLSAFFITLYKYTGQKDLIIGSPCANRIDLDVKNLIGMFVNNLAIRAKILENQTVIDFLDIMQKNTTDDLIHQSYPYDILVKKLNIPQNSNLFDIVFTYQTPSKDNTLVNLNAKLFEIKTNSAKFNITFEVNPDNGQIGAEYRTDIFKEPTIKSLLDHYTFILNQIIDVPNLKIEDLNIITPREEKLLERFNDTSDKINPRTASEIFEEQARLNPNNIALICDDQKLTYRELNERANSLAHLLFQKGIKSNDIVGIMTNRSLETVICMLAILKAGAAFLNLDPTYPADRTNYYIENSKIQHVLVQKELHSKVSKIADCINIDLDIESIYSVNKNNLGINSKASDLSYIIYTSGSTGQPKGVMLNQIGLSNMVQAMTRVLDYLREGNKHTLVSVTSTPFDIFVYEIIVSLTHGLKVVMANNAEHRNPQLLDELIKKYNVDVMTVTPSLMKINYDNRKPNTALAKVKNMVFGGEPLPEKFVKDLRALADDITIYNIYGPSEITVLSNVQNLDNEKEITIGPPILNTQIHILDKNMKEVPIGVAGEIYISGIQVGMGYIGKPDLTEEKFLENPFGIGKIYKSGDIGRWTFDGKVQCLGRLDHQVKLHGLRIELGEIENIISNINGVTSSIVTKIEINNKEVLCAYFVADRKIPDKDVRSILRAALPNYMVPTYIIQLDEMPYTINRKIDRKSLPIPNAYKSIDSEKINIYELNSNEEKLIQIWKNILKIPEVHIDDNFFDIGGDSISAINMQIEALKYGLHFEYADIFNFPTIKQLSHKLPAPQKSFSDNYDYSKINTILSRNSTEAINSISSFNVNNILLIGATGFLGAHILYEFLQRENGIIYCLLRQNEAENLKVKLKKSLDFYFGEDYLQNNIDRIKIIKGDIIESNLGMSNKDFDVVVQNVNCVINSAALVKHFGAKDIFYKTNVTGTKNVLDFCLKNSKRLLHISTISVSGFGEKEEALNSWSDEEGIKEFSEQNLYIKQTLKGIYSITKYQAEIAVLEAISKGLDATILRIGNITNRFSDGVFQRNVTENAFARRLKSFIEIGAMPREMLGHYIELTPVDLCSKAILHILEHSSSCNVIHLYNTNLLPVDSLFDTLNNHGYDIVPVKESLMSTILNGLLADDLKKDLVAGIIQDINIDKKIIYISKIALRADFSREYLEKCGFTWPEYDSEYIEKCLNYYEKIKFLEGHK